MSSASALRRRTAVVLAGCALVFTSARVSAREVASDRIDRLEPAPKRLRGIGVDEHLGQSLPASLTFTDSSGRSVSLGDYFKKQRPVVLTMNYSSCPMLCSLQLNGFVEALKQLDLVPGVDFEILTISLDPRERPAEAAETKARYLRQLGKDEAAKGWHFLTGQQFAIDQMASALGVRYGYNERRKEYVHPAVVSIASPDRRIARYLYGIEYDPRTLRLSLTEASAGKIGTTVDRLILYCFHYDESEGRYAPVARRLMSMGGGIAVLIFGSFLSTLWIAEARKRRRTSAESTT